MAGRAARTGSQYNPDGNAPDRILTHSLSAALNNVPYSGVDVRKVAGVLLACQWAPVGAPLAEPAAVALVSADGMFTSRPAGPRPGGERTAPAARGPGGATLSAREKYERAII